MPTPDCFAFTVQCTVHCVGHSQGHRDAAAPILYAVLVLQSKASHGFCCSPVRPDDVTSVDAGSMHDSDPLVVHPVIDT
jgi:hypothetical protein